METLHLKSLDTWWAAYVIMMIPGALAPNRYQAISSHHTDQAVTRVSHELNYTNTNILL